MPGLPRPGPGPGMHAARCNRCECLLCVTHAKGTQPEVDRQPEVDLAQQGHRESGRWPVTPTRTPEAGAGAAGAGAAAPAEAFV